MFSYGYNVQLSTYFWPWSLYNETCSTKQWNDNRETSGWFWILKGKKSKYFETSLFSSSRPTHSFFFSVIIWTPHCSLSLFLPLSLDEYIQSQFTRENNVCRSLKASETAEQQENSLTSSFLVCKQRNVHPSSQSGSCETLGSFCRLAAITGTVSVVRKLN